MDAKFHLALPCSSIRDTANFYVSYLEAKIGRNTDNWVDLNLYGNQLTFTAAGFFKFDYKNYKLNDQILPSFHFGVIVDVDTWAKIYSRLLKENLDVTTEATFLENKIGEHLSFFVTDPNGYVVEFKSFKSNEEIFKTDILDKK